MNENGCKTYLTQEWRPIRIEWPLIAQQKAVIAKPQDIAQQKAVIAFRMVTNSFWAKITTITAA